MASNLPLGEILKDLEARLAFHQGQARHHEEEKARHQREIEEISRKLATFRAALAEAESLSQLAPLPSDGEGAGEPGLEPGGKVYAARLVARVVDALPAGEPFGISKVTEEVNRRYQEHLDRPLKAKQVSVVLRWMLRTHRIRSLQKGRPFHEALYVR